MGRKLRRYIEEHQIWTVSDGIFVLDRRGICFSLRPLGGGRTPIPPIIAEVEQEQVDEEARARDVVAGKRQDGFG